MPLFVFSNSFETNEEEKQAAVFYEIFVTKQQIKCQ